MESRNNIAKSKLGVRLRALASLPIMAPIVATLGVPAWAQDAADLERRLEALQAEVAALKSSRAPEAEEDNPYLLKDGDGIRIGDTTVSFGGFIKADVIVGSNGDGTENAYSVGVPRSFAAYARSDQNDWQVGFTARESRFSFGTATVDVLGDVLTTYLEMDFNDNATGDGNEIVSNSYNPRLRQAFGSWKGWTIGQTYTTFSNLATLPEILNQGKMAGFIYTTQALIRYTMPVPGGKLLMSLENPEDASSSFEYADDLAFAGETLYDDQSIPDIVVRYDITGDYGVYSVAGMVRRIDSRTDEAWTGAGSLSARIPTIGKDDVRLQYSYGALGRYMGLYLYPDSNYRAEMATGGDVDPFDSQGITAAYRHFWTAAWRSTLSVSHTEAVDDPFTTGTLGGLDSATSTHANLIWTPHPNMTYGIEYAYWDFDTYEQPGSDQYQQAMLSAQFQF